MVWPLPFPPEMRGWGLPNSFFSDAPPGTRLCGIHSTPYGPPIIPAATDPAELRRVQLLRLKALDPEQTVEETLVAERQEFPDEPPRSLPMNAALFMLLPPSLYREPSPYPYTMGDAVAAIEQRQGQGEG